MPSSRPERPVNGSRYLTGNRVGLVVFQKDRATLVLPPANSIQLARKALSDIPVGGKTPLSAGLYLAHRQVLEETRISFFESSLYFLGDDMNVFTNKVHERLLLAYCGRSGRHAIRNMI